MSMARAFGPAIVRCVPSSRVNQCQCLLVHQLNVCLLCRPKLARRFRLGDTYDACITGGRVSIQACSQYKRRCEVIWPKDLIA